MNEEQPRRMNLVEVDGLEMGYFSALSQTEKTLTLAVFTLDPPEQEGIDCDDPEEQGRLVVLSEVNYRALMEEVSAVRRQQMAVIDASPATSGRREQG